MLVRSRFWTSQISLTMDQWLVERWVKVNLFRQSLLVPLPFYFSQQISASSFNGTPIASKAVYLLDGSQWPTKLLLNLTTNQNGLADFTLNTADLPKADLSLVVSWYFFLFIYFKWRLVTGTNSIHCSPGKCDSRGCLWLQIAILQFRNKNS